eukprot:4235932-Amphidinium_carterae.1
MERPWRERRDMLVGILSAASVEDRQQVVARLDARFEEFADLEDYEIACGICEYIGVDIPREGGIRRTALRRWALDPQRGGSLPVMRLIDFIDGENAIAVHIAADLRKRGRVADAAVLMARLPTSSLAGHIAGDTRVGDAELERLCSILAMGHCGFDAEEELEPVRHGAVKLPFSLGTGLEYIDSVEAAESAAARLQEARVLALSVWQEEAPFWYSPVVIIVMCSEDFCAVFDLLALRSANLLDWAKVARQLRALLSERETLK